MIIKPLRFTLLLGLCIGCLANWAGAEPKALNIQHWTTSQGTPVYFVATESPDIVDIRLAFAAGSARDGEQWGLAALTNNMLSQGSASLSADDIAEQFSMTGAIYSHTLDRDMAVLGLRSLTQPSALQQALNTFIQVAAQPSFPLEALDRTIKRQITAIDYDLQSPSNIATNAFYETLYSKHPYGHPILGDKTMLSQLDQQAIANFHHRYYTAQNAVIALVGTMSTEQAKTISEQLSSALATGEKAPPLTEPLPPIAPTTDYIHYPTTQSNIRLGQLGISYQSPDYFPLLVGNYILGGGILVSRLNEEVREKRGLSYAVSSSFIRLDTTGPFIISLGTANDQTEQAIEVVQNTLTNYLTQGPSEDELQAAKAYLSGNFPLNLDSNQAIASILLRIGFYQLPLDYLDTYTTQVNAVNLKEVHDIIKQQINPNKLTTVIVSDAE